MSEKDPPDYELMQLIAKGDQDAHEALYERYRVPLERHVGYLRKSLPWLDGADAIQETFMRVRENAHTFKRGLPALPWLQAILKHYSYKESRQQRREVRVEGEVESEPLDAHALDSKLELLDFYRTLAKLSDEDQNLINSAVFIGRSPSELAKEFGISPETLRVRLCRARKRLAEHMRKE